uniref:Zuotin-like zuotin homology domain-containing protein n=1 Tax=Parascaris equorum TaxID=6256 RepID=A0A914S2E5_PAREQ
LFFQVVGPFYGFWQSFSTARSFVWLDKYDIREARNRYVVRAMEKENKKLRDAGKKERNEQIRNLVAFVRRRDERVQRYKKVLEEQTHLENLREIEEALDAEFGDESALAENGQEDVDGNRLLYCIVCEKAFRTDQKADARAKKSRKQKRRERKKAELSLDGEDNSDDAVVEFVFLGLFEVLIETKN